VNYAGGWTRVTWFRKVETRTTTRHTIGAGRAANWSGEFLPAHSGKTLHRHTIQRILDFPGEIPVGETRTEEWRLARSKSVQPEADLDADLHIDRLTIFHRRLKAPLSYSFDGFGVESETKPADDADISWVSFGINNQPKDASSLALGSSRFLCVFGIRSGNRLRS